MLLEVANMANDRDTGDGAHSDQDSRPDGASEGWRPAGTHQRVMLAAGRLSRALHSMAVIARADGVALMLANAPSGLRAVGGSTAEGLSLEYAEQLAQAGPAHDAVSAGLPVAVDDLDDLAAHPARPGRPAHPARSGYARPELTAAPVRAVLAVPVHVEGDVVGALNFYRCTPCIWTSRQIEVGEHLADTTADLLVRLAADPAADGPARP